MQDIPIGRLAFSFIPALVTVVILFTWSLGAGRALYAMARMVLQLLLVGYLLVFIFDAENYWIVLGVLLFMMVVASHIALQSLGPAPISRLPIVFLSIFVGGVSTLLLVTQVVLQLAPFWQPRAVIPLAGMIFANAMNCISLAGERLESELKDEKPFVEARNVAYRVALIPITNSMFSVGLVSLPGMMTGQILDGTSPLIAVRYQILVMCMVFGSGGIATACYLRLLQWQRANASEREASG